MFSPLFFIFGVTSCYWSVGTCIEADFEGAHSQPRPSQRFCFCTLWKERSCGWNQRTIHLSSSDCPPERGPHRGLWCMSGPSVRLLLRGSKTLVGVGNINRWSTPDEAIPVLRGKLLGHVITLYYWCCINGETYFKSCIYKMYKGQSKMNIKTADQSEM